MAGKTYSLLNFHCAIAGPGGLINIGAGAGVGDEGIKFVPNEDINSMEVGPDGNGQHSLHGNKSGTITLTLLKTSVTNALLMAMYNFQTANPANHGQNTITGTDGISGDVITCQQVAFKRKPDINYGKTAGTNTWVFEAVQMDSALGF